MRRVRWIPTALVAAVLLGVFASAGRAAVNFDFVTDNNNGNYTVLPNGTTTVDLFLRETLTAGSTSILVSQNGMAGIGTTVTRTTSPSAPAVITAAAVDPNYVTFGSATVASGGAKVDIVGNASFDVNTGPIITDSATVRRVRYGQVTIQGGLIPLQTTTFTIGDHPGSDDNVTFGSTGSSLDTQIAARTFTVSVLPEPTTAAGLLGAAGLVLVRRRRLRR